MKTFNEWLPSTLILSDKVFLMRPQYSNRGPKITKFGMQSTQPELSTRRKSVISLENGNIYFIIGSVIYDKPYDTKDPLESLRFFDKGKFQTLKKWLIHDSLEDAVLWTGFPQDVESHFNATLVKD